MKIELIDRRARTGDACLETLTGAARSQYRRFPVHEPACAAGDKDTVAVCNGGCHQKRFAVEHPSCPRTVLPRDDNSTVGASRFAEAVPGCNTPHRTYQIRNLKFLCNGARREGEPRKSDEDDPFFNLLASGVQLSNSGQINACFDSRHRDESDSNFPDPK